MMKLAVPKSTVRGGIATPQDRDETQLLENVVQWASLHYGIEMEWRA
jgi:hypothetical protein